MGIIFGNQVDEAMDAVQPQAETPVEEPKSVEQPAEEPVAPSDDDALRQEAVKPPRRTRKRKTDA